MIGMGQSHTHHNKEQINCCLITVSDTRNKETDKSGQFILDKFRNHKYTLLDYQIIKDDQLTIGATLDTMIGLSPDILIINGGTGIAERDVTIEAVQPKLNKELPGFGELFRMLSYQEDIGSRAILSRAVAGVIGTTAVFSLPGSTGAVRLAMEKLILPEIDHLVFELNK